MYCEYPVDLREELQGALRMRIKPFSIVLIIILITVISGCTDELGTVDFSGQIELEQASSGWAYRNIASTKVRPVKVDPEDRLGDYQGDLELQKPISIGKGDYIIVARFKTDRFSTGHDILDHLLKTDRFTAYGDYQILLYDFNSKDRVKTIVAKDSESGNDWDNKIDDPRSNFKTRNLERKGEFIQYFREPASGRDCIIEVGYELKSKAVRSVSLDDKFLEEDGEYKYEELSVDGSAWINVGFQQCLTGRRIIGGETIQFYLLDWDLNGEFSEADMVWSDYTGQKYKFGEVVRLTDSWVAKKDNTYRLKLITPRSEQEKYKLEIELVSRGKK